MVVFYYTDVLLCECSQHVGSAGSEFSVILVGGNLYVCKPGNFVSTLGIEAGIALAFGGSLWDGEEDRVFTLFVEGAESSLSTGKLSPPSTDGITLDELKIVVRTGRVVCSVLVDDAVGGVEGIGRCSIVSLDDRPEVDTEMGGGGFRFFLTSELEDSRLELLLPPSPRAFGRGETGVFDLDDDERTSRSVGVSPRCNFASTSRSVTCRLRGVPSPPFRLKSLPARLLFTLSLPSMIFAGGGG
jgi:hypothetical protein